MGTNSAPKVGLYIRVSSADQNLDLQRTELLAFAKARGWNVVKLFEEKASAATTNRPQLKLLMRAAQTRELDIVCVWKLDRAFRSLRDCMNGLHEFAALGVDFVSLRDPGVDMTTASGKLLLGLLACFAEFERSLIVERVRAGVHAKIAKTGKWGPARKRDDLTILRLRKSGLSIRQIAKQLQLSPTSVARGLKGVPGTGKNAG